MSADKGKVTFVGSSRWPPGSCLCCGDDPTVTHTQAAPAELGGLSFEKRERGPEVQRLGVRMGQTTGNWRERVRMDMINSILHTCMRISKNNLLIK